MPDHELIPAPQPVSLPLAPLSAPPLLDGTATPEVRTRVERFYRARVRQLLALPQGHEVLATRDRAILSFYLYSGARIAAGCKLAVADFHYDREDSTIRLQEKGGEYRTLGLHFVAAEAIHEYLDQA